MSETFRTTWNGWAVSSQGFRVRVAGRTGIDYDGPEGRFRIDSEVMAAPRREIVVYADRFTQAAEPLRSIILERTGRALLASGWQPVSPQ